MFDQSFSVKNFRKIFDVDRKNKGTIEVKHFPTAFIIRKKINRLRYFAKLFSYKYKAGLISESRFEYYKDRINSHIDIRKEQYNNEVNRKLNDIVEKVSIKGYSLPISKLSYQVKSKDVFSLGESVESLFVSKHIQNILCSLYNIEINHRDLIISRLSTLTKDGSPKYIVRADIEQFYESISHKSLLNILHSSTKLSVTPRRVITQLIRNYSTLTGDSFGLPRGIGLSSFLSEIYMDIVDKEIRALNDVTYYERYVDDLIVIFSPTSTDNLSNYLRKIKNIIKSVKLTLNNKTVELNLYNETNKKFDYLGYEFNIQNSSCTIKLSNKKKQKIRNRINYSFDHYNQTSKAIPKRSYRLLLSRIRFLTGNTRLYNSKSKAFVGIYFSNKFITDTSDLHGLDMFLLNKVNNLNDNKLKNRLRKFSFQKGFEEKIFRKFSIEELSDISKAWKND
ncbi:TPA: RNA-directed DNA polymerase [Vibrio parahaemolyticus]|nr:RNA-directed DNA polymerase [Vibrio parahaemolyticus]